MLSHKEDGDDGWQFQHVPHRFNRRLAIYDRGVDLLMTIILLAVLVIGFVLLWRHFSGDTRDDHEISVCLQESVPGFEAGIVELEAKNLADQALFDFIDGNASWQDFEMAREKSKTEAIKRRANFIEAQSTCQSFNFTWSYKDPWYKCVSDWQHAVSMAGLFEGYHRIAEARSVGNLENVRSSLINEQAAKRLRISRAEADCRQKFDVQIISNY